MSPVPIVNFTDDIKVSEIKDLVLQHYQDFPEHGAGCSCLDQLQGRLRYLTTIGTLKERLDDPILFKAQNAVNGIMYHAHQYRT
jgi:hypothetical protein